MSSALNKPKYMIIDNYYNQIATKRKFNSLNTAFATEGAYINIPAKVADKPIEIMYFSTGNEALMVQPRTIVGENSHVQIIEPPKLNEIQY
jgi:Fe-S cluster assembly protein SufD